MSSSTSSRSTKKNILTFGLSHAYTAVVVPTYEVTKLSMRENPSLHVQITHDFTKMGCYPRARWEKPMQQVDEKTYIPWIDDLDQYYHKFEFVLRSIGVDHGHASGFATDTDLHGTGIAKALDQLKPGHWIQLKTVPIPILYTKTAEEWVQREVDDYLLWRIRNEEFLAKITKEENEKMANRAKESYKRRKRYDRKQAKRGKAV